MAMHLNRFVRINEQIGLTYSEAQRAIELLSIHGVKNFEWQMKIHLFTKPHCGWCHQAMRGPMSANYFVEAMRHQCHVSSAKGKN